MALALQAHQALHCTDAGQCGYIMLHCHSTALLCVLNRMQSCVPIALQAHQAFHCRDTGQRGQCGVCGAAGSRTHGAARPRRPQGVAGAWDSLMTVVSVLQASKALRGLELAFVIAPACGMGCGLGGGSRCVHRKGTVLADTSRVCFCGKPYAGATHNSHLPHTPAALFICLHASAVLCQHLVKLNTSEAQ